MSDLGAVAAALAARYDDVSRGGGVTSPAGEPTLVGSTSAIPVALNGTPQVCVFPPTLDPYRVGPGVRLFTATFPVRFYLMELLNEGRDYARLYNWHTAMADIIYVGGVHLGLSPYVSHAKIVRVAFGDLNYGGAGYIGFEHSVEVQITEGIQPVA